MIHVCSLARLHETVEDTGARHVVSLIGDEGNVVRPHARRAGEPSVAAAARYFLAARRLHHAGRGARRRSHPLRARLGPRSPLVVHCYMGISRSTASAYACVCALNPQRDEAASPRRCAAPHRRRRPISASCRLPTVCSAATAAWSPPSRPSAEETLPRKPRRSASTLSRMRQRRILELATAIYGRGLRWTA